MAKYLKHDGVGGIKEENGLHTSSGAGDSGKIIETDATGRIDSSILPVGIGDDAALLEASENLSAGDFINIWNDGGTAKVRKADATTNGMICKGFVLSAVTTGNDAKVYFEGTNTQLSGMTPGSVIFLSTTAGAKTETVPSATGNIVQRLGVAISDTELTFESQQPIELI